MSDIAEQIGGLAASAIMILILFVVLGTLWGGDPGVLSELLESGAKIIVYVAIIGIFGALVLSVIAGSGR